MPVLRLLEVQAVQAGIAPYTFSNIYWFHFAFYSFIKAKRVRVQQSPPLLEQHVLNDVTGLRGLVGVEWGAWSSAAQMYAGGGLQAKSRKYNDIITHLAAGSTAAAERLSACDRGIITYVISMNHSHRRKEKHHQSYNIHENRWSSWLIWVRQHAVLLIMMQVFDLYVT